MRTHLAVSFFIVATFAGILSALIAPLAGILLLLDGYEPIVSVVFLVCVGVLVVDALLLVLSARFRSTVSRILDSLPDYFWLP